MHALAPTGTNDLRQADGVAMGDKGYDSKANRQAARRRGGAPVIPYRSTAKSKPTFFPKRSTKAAPASSKQSENPSALSGSRYGAGRPNKISPPSSPSPQASS
jgi:hypothetical protein